MEYPTKAIKVSTDECPTIPLKGRMNFKMVDPTTVGSRHLTFGMVVIEPGVTCEPGHDHADQEEIFFCLTGKGVVIVGEERREIPISPKEGVFMPIGTYHCIRNSGRTPLEVLWIISPAGWVFDHDNTAMEYAKEGRAYEKA